MFVYTCLLCCCVDRCLVLLFPECPTFFEYMEMCIMPIQWRTQGGGARGHVPLP